MSKFFKIFHKQCVIEKKTYFLTIKYGFDLNPLEVVLKEKNLKKLYIKQFLWTTPTKPNGFEGAS